MKSALFLLAISMIIPSAVSAADYEIIGSDRASVTVRFTPGRPVVTPLGQGDAQPLSRIAIPGYISEKIDGRPVLPVQRFFFEVPADRGIRLQVVEKEPSFIEGVLPEVWFDGTGSPEEAIRILSDRSILTAGEHAVIAATGVYRKRHLVLIDLYPVLFDAESSRLVYSSSITIRLSFDPESRVKSWPEDHATVEMPGDRFIVNASQASAWRSSPEILRPLARTPFEFALSDNWVRLTVGSSGIYQVTYNDLYSAGINPLLIDPATMRIFSSGPLRQPEELDDGGSFEEDYHMTEHAIHYIGADLGAFSPGESILFHGLGTRGWKDHIDPDNLDLEFYEHPYAKENIYWLTWGGSFPSGPRRMAERDVSNLPADPDTVIDSYQHRLHNEQDYAYDPQYTDDGWYWRLLGYGNNLFTNNFTLSDVTDGSGMLRSIAYSPYDSFELVISDFFINGTKVGSLDWRSVHEKFVPETLMVDLDNLLDSSNQFKVSIQTGDFMYMMWYDIFYKRDLIALDGAIDFFTPRFDGRAGFAISGFPSGGIYLLDVTSFGSPAFLTTEDITGGIIEFEDVIGGARRHYLAAASNVLLTPGIEAISARGEAPVSLRDDPVSPHMLIVHNGRFEDAASMLAGYRETNLPGTVDPVVRAVDIDDIYDNFSNGMKDPIAIRNYVKFLYDNFSDAEGPIIRYLVLMGNGTNDPRDILGTGNDYLPLFMKDYGREVVEDDDHFVRLDDSDDWFIDVAIGRMPVFTAAQAQRWVRDIIEYESGDDMGEWRDEVILVADDEFSTHTDCDFGFLDTSEDMTLDYTYFPDFIDFNKIYLHEYPFDGNFKPGARQALRDAWNDGALIINYIGHGAPNVMADEVVMEKADIPALTNGNKRPLFLAFSCSVANIESPFQTSIGQDLVLSGDGGAIAVIGGTGGTYADPNKTINYRFMMALFTSEDSTGTETLGNAMIFAKPYSSIPSNQLSLAQFLILGDPATKIALPSYQVEHERSEIDSMLTGKRYTFHGTVRSGGAVYESFNGKADIIIQESSREVNEPHPCIPLATIKYDLPGKSLFRGSVDVTGGRFTADFVVPLRCRTGSKARVRSYISSLNADGVGADDHLLIMNNPDPPDNQSPPDIDIYFAGQADKVKKGAILNVEISDTDGISILGKDPQSSIYLEFDRSGYFRAVTDYFKYDHGSSTKGKVEYPIPSGFTPGDHSVVVRAFDNLGAQANDTLQFEMIEDGLYTISDVFNMPNPVRVSTNFIFQLSSVADVILRLYNVSGREIWSSKIYGREGYNSIYWDGRDRAGDIPANGTYIYMIDVSFRNSYNRSETVTGKVVLLR
ncbi:MAG: type IX secretion system sortase PorU [Candidatus Krumholzibacteriota bacterium]|nr:type IX secretion system sortase PorU [Candidatus Krumholzibacteriota bacterium]